MSGATRHVELSIETGPAPLAQLARRARNSKTGTAMLQNAAHYLGEAAAALAAAYWLGRSRQVKSEQLASILSRGPSFGAMIGLLRDAVTAAGTSELEALCRPFDDTTPQAELAAAIAASEELGELRETLRAGLKQARDRGTMGMLELLVTFRNRIFAHGAMLPESAARRLAKPLLDAVCQAINSPSLFEGAWLGRTGVDLLSQDERRYWKRLHGHAESAVEDRGVPSAAEVDSRYLYFLGPRGPISLSFWVVQDEDATGLSRFGFFSRTIGKFKGVEYLNYLAGPFRYDALVAEVREAAVARAVEELGAPAEAQPAGDQRRLGDFVIESELGRGAMGIVYLATQVSLGRKVALKVLPPVLLDDPVALGRFNREIRGLGRCDHPNVVRVLTSGVDEGRPYYAMELVDGADLSVVFDTLARWKKSSPELDGAYLAAASSSRRRRGLGQEDVPHAEPAMPELLELERRGDLFVELARLFAAAAEGVEEIHSRGLLHRDLKPANLMLTADGERLIVMDLGLAKLEDASIAYTRDSGTDFVGSARYAAPEQIQARLMKVDHRADLYSLGATLYELATLTTIYPAESVAELLQQKLTGDPLPPRDLDRRIPKDLDTIIQRAIARQPEARYASAAELAADLSAFASGRPIAARPPSAYDYLRLFYRREKRGVHAAAAALMLVLAIVAGSFVLISQQKAEAIDAQKRAELNEARAVEQEREASAHLASFFLERAHRAEERRDWRLAAGYFAAARQHEDSEEARLGQAFAEPRALIPLAAESIEGPLLLSADARTVIGRRAAYELSAGDQVRKIYELSESVGWPRVLASRREFLVATLGERLWFGRGGSRLELIEVPGGQPTALALSEDELLLAVGDDRGEIFSGELDRKPIVWKRVGRQTAAIQRLAFTIDGAIIAASADGRLRSWRAGSKAGFAPLISGSGAPVRAIAASPIWPELLITGGDDGAIRFWQATSGAELQAINLAGVTRALAVSPDGRWLAVAGEEGSNELIDLDTGQRAALLPGRSSSAVAISQDLISIATEDEARWYRFPAALAPLVRMQAPELEALDAVFSGDGRRLAAIGARRAYVFDAQDGDLLLDVEVEAGPPALSWNGAIFAAGGRAQISIFPVPGGLSNPWVIEKADTFSLAFSEAGGIAAATADGEISIWDSARGSRKLEVPGDTLGFDDQLAIKIRSKLFVPNSALIFSSDGSKFAAATGDGKHVRVWENRKIIVDFALDSSGVRALAFSPDSKNVAIADHQGGVSVIDGSGRPRFVLQTGAAEVAFLDGEHLLSCGEELQLFSIPEARALATIALGFECLAICATATEISIAGHSGAGRTFVRKIPRTEAVAPAALLEKLRLDQKELNTKG